MIDSDEKYWGMIDISEGELLFNSNEEITSINQVDDPEHKSMSFMITKENSYSLICPFATFSSSTTCTKCSQYLLLDSTIGNSCESSASNFNHSSSGSYYKCPSGSYYSSNSCVTCSSDSSKITLSPYNQCVDKSTAESNPVYVCDSSGCTHCKGNGQYVYTNPDTSKSCVGDIPTGSYVSDVQNNVLSNCDGACATCSKGTEGTNSNCDTCKDGNYLQPSGGNCDSTCDASSIYGKHYDTTIKTCVICDSIGKVKYEGTEECIDLPDTDTNYYYTCDSNNGIIKPCGNGCNSCDENDICKTCIDTNNKKINTGTSTECVSSCGDVLGYDPSSNYCVDCKTYQSSTEYYRYIDDEQCQLPLGNENVDYVVKDPDKNVLIKCPSGSTSCELSRYDNGTYYAKSLTCDTDNNFVLFEGTCMLKCADNEGIYDGTCKNCSTLPNKYKKEDSFYCEDKPEHGYYISDEENHIISKCHSDCLDCDGGYNDTFKNCTKCNNGYYTKHDRSDCEGNCSYNSYVVQDDTKMMCVNCKDNDDGNIVRYENQDCMPLPSSNVKFYYISEEFGVIRNCAQNCERCQKKSDSIESICSECQSLFYMSLTSDACSTECADNETTTYYPFGKNPYTHRCEKCPSNDDGRIYKLEDSQECISAPTEYKYVIVNNDLGIIERCDSACETCSSKPEGGNSKCKTCADGKYLQPDVGGNCDSTCPETHGKETVNGINKCVECNNGYKKVGEETCTVADSLPEGYFLVRGFETYNVIDKCYEGCRTCSDKSTDENDMLCNSCMNGKYLEYVVTTDPNDGSLSGQYTNNCIEHCDLFLYEDSQHNECVNCKESGKYFYKGECVDTILDGTYESNIFYGTLSPCYSSCKRCTSLGDSTDHKCTECNDAYEFDTNLFSNCNPKCDLTQFYFYYDSSNQFHCTTSRQCPLSYPILIESDNHCITSTQCANLNKYIHESKCVSQCPNGYKVEESECVLEAVAEGDCKYSSKSDSNVNIMNAETSLRAAMNDYADNTDDSIVSVIEGNGVRLTIFKNAQCGYNISINHNVSYANITTCINKIKTDNNISNDTSLIIGEVELIKSDTTNSISGYIITDPTGNSYSLNSCNHLTISVSSPITAETMSELLLGRQLFEEKGIDIFNPSDSFFNDLCYPYTDENGNDVPISNRRSDFFRNSSLCEEGCEYELIDYLNERVTCNCPIKQNKFDSIKENLPCDDFPIDINMNNFKVLKCSKNVFSSLAVKKNAGSWFMIVLMVLEIPILINLVIIGYQPIYAYLNQFSQERIEEELNKQSKSESSEDASRANPPKKNSKPRRSNIISEYDSPAMLVKPKTREVSSVNLSSKVNDVKIYNSAAPVAIETTQQLNREIEEEETLFDDDELDDLAYEDALEYDKRCICVFFLHCLKANLALINVFANISVLEPITVRLIGFLLNIAVFVGFNVIFFDESYISDRYKLKEESADFGYIIENELPKSVYASITSVAVGFLINYVTSSRKRFETLMDKEKENKKFLVETRKIIANMKKTMITFIIISTGLMLFFWYFICAFCSVYQNSQGALFIGCAITLLVCWLMQTVLSFIVTLFRYMGLKCHISCFYTLSTYFC